MDWNYDHQMSLSKSKCLYSNNCLHFLKRAVPSMRLCHPPDGSTSPKYKLLRYITTKFFCKEKNALAFNRDRCCHLVLCLRLIPFHSIYTGKNSFLTVAKKMKFCESQVLSLSVCRPFIINENNKFFCHFHETSGLDYKSVTNVIYDRNESGQEPTLEWST